ncbi:MAG: guanylate kinase [Ruminococcaceae bacterium]|jgi:guanylate kinase|nr:guanylate kinase [Oscillospiraceae bacterium]
MKAMSNGILIVFSGPSGAGKDTILNDVLLKDKALQKSVSLTTRDKRSDETEGVDYYFISLKEFKDKLDNGEILEYAQYGQNFYGTPKAPVDRWLSEGKTVILKIEVQGAANIKELYPESVSIFLLPPSIEELENRLRTRETDSQEDILRRMTIAEDEFRKSVNYDYIVINNKVEDAVNDVLSIIRAEQLKSKRMKNYISEVTKNV